MRRPLNLIVTSLFVILLLLLVKLKLYDIYDQYNVPAYVQSAVGGGRGGLEAPGPVEEKVVVMAKIQKEDTSWVDDSLFE